jgi:hypothetical protein
MSTRVEIRKSHESSFPGIFPRKVRERLSGRLGLIVLATVLAAGITFNWGWLIAVGAAPVLVALVPCAVMCVLGLCMSTAGSKSCSKEPALTDARKETPT